MGSWAELDAVYPPGALSPAAALVVALGRQAGATSVYAPGARTLAAFAPEGIAYDAELIERAEHFFGVPEDAFFAAADALLHRRQRLCLALRLLECARSGGARDAGFAGRALAALGIAEDDLPPSAAARAIIADLSIFPQ